MPKQTYIVKSGDTLANVSRAVFGVPNRTEDLVRLNPKLQFRRDAGNTDAIGNPNLQGGEPLYYISTSSLVGLQDETLADVLDESVPALHINGLRDYVPDGSSATIHYDACANLFSMGRTWNPFGELDRDRWGNPFALPEYELYLGSRKLQAGRFQTIQYGTDANDTRVFVEGRTHTGVLEKTAFLFNMYPLERKNESLTQIAEWAASPWSVPVTGTPLNTSPFKKVSAEPSTPVWEFISNLATQRNSVVRADNSGHALEIVTPQLTDPIAYWEHGVNGFRLPDQRFDTTKIYDIHQGISRRARNVKRKRTFEYPLVNDGSVMYHDLPNQDEGTTGDSLQYLAIKALRDFFTITLERPGLLNDDGEHWQTGDIIALKAPHAALYNFTNFMIRSITYNFNTTNPSVSLRVIPPEVYMGVGIPNFPWDN